MQGNNYLKKRLSPCTLDQALCLITIAVLNAGMGYQADKVNYCFYGFKFNLGIKLIYWFTESFGGRREREKFLLPLIKERVIGFKC